MATCGSGRQAAVRGLLGERLTSMCMGLLVRHGHARMNGAFSLARMGGYDVQRKGNIRQRVTI